MKTLGQVSGSRDNNLNLLRAVAATAVLVSHAWPIAIGPEAVQPLDALTGHTLGSMAVFIFFVISGFLIAGSYENASSRTGFVVARVLRLIPGLFVSLLLVGLLMGPIVSALSPTDYLGRSEVWTFILRNTTLAFPQYTLPGVFENNPYPTVEGSIWTLVHEAICYVGIFVIGILGLLPRKTLISGLFVLFVIGWMAIEISGAPLNPRVMNFHGLVFPFAVGTMLYMWRDRVPLQGGIAVILIVLAAILKGTVLYEIGYIAALAYASFWLAYIPSGFIRRYNDIGDYSYGIYIYAFPIQGLVVWLWGPMSPMLNIALALPLTLIPSVLSWHLVEKPALGVRHQLTEALTRKRAKVVG